MFIDFIIEKELIHKKEGNFLIVQYEEKKNARDSLFSSLLIINGFQDLIGLMIVLILEMLFILIFGRIRVN